MTTEKQDNTRVETPIVMLEVPYQQGILNYLHRKLPEDHREVLGDIDEDAVCSLWLIYGKLKKSFRPLKGGMSFDSYFYRWAGRTLVESYMNKEHGLYQKMRRLKSLTEMQDAEIKKDEKDGHQHHKYGKWEEPVARNIYDELEGNDLLSQIETIAKSIGMDAVLPLMIAGWSEREIADKVKMPRGTLHKRIVTLRKSVAEKILQPEGTRFGKLA